MQLDIKSILERLPHRYPMLLIDRVLEMVPGKSIKALKNVSINEPFFVGHFPHHPVMPGVLILEAMAQAAAIFSFAEETGLKKVFTTLSELMVLGFGNPCCLATSYTLKLWLSVSAARFASIRGVPLLTGKRSQRRS